MAEKYLLTDHEYQYQITGEPSYVAIIPCTTDNSRQEEDGTITIFGIPNAPIAINKLRVRVKGQGINPPSAWLYNSVAFIETELEEFNFYISDSEGDDLNDGLTRLTAKKTYASALPLISAAGAGTKVGFKAGDVFNEEINVPIAGMVYSAYDKSAENRAAYIKSTRELNSGWVLKAGTVNTWEMEITDGPVTSPDGYNNVYVLEVDRATEGTAEFTAVKYLKIVTSDADVESTEGSFRVVPFASLPYKIQVHTTGGVSPNANPNYKYLIPSTVYGVRALTNVVTDFSNFILLDAVGGYGPLAMSGKIRKVVSRGGSTHTGVVGKGADMEHCAFLGNMTGGAKGDIGLVIYSDVIEGNINKLKNIRFFDSSKVFYTHASSGGDALSMTLQKIHFFGALGITKILAEIVSHENFLMEDCFGENSENAFSPCTGNNVIRNNIFNNCGGYYYNHTADTNVEIRNNMFAKIKVGLTGGGKDTVVNNIIWLKDDTAGGRFFSPYNTAYKNIIRNNIIIADCGSFEVTFNNAWQEVVGGVPQEGTCSTLIADNNVYIKISGAINWQIRNHSDGSTNNFNTWKSRMGVDTNSLYFDLSSEPLGLKKIFADPDNGDWTYTNDPIALQIQALQAGMTSLVTHYPERPTLEQASQEALNMVALPDLFN